MPETLEQRTCLCSWAEQIISIVVVPLLVIGIVVWGVGTGQDPVAVFSLAVATLVAYLASIRPFLERPRLVLYIDKVRCSPPVIQSDIPSWFIRLKIGNYGMTPAKDCVGRLFGVWPDRGKRLKKFDPLTLFWARQDKCTGFSPVIIQGGDDFEYLDIAQVKNKGTAPLELRVVIPSPMTLTNWPEDCPSPGTDPVLQKGTYYLLIGVQAANARIKPSWFELACTGMVPDSCDEQPPCQIQEKKPRFARKVCWDRKVPDLGTV